MKQEVTDGPYRLPDLTEITVFNVLTICIQDKHQAYMFVKEVVLKIHHIHILALSHCCVSY